MDKLNKLNKGNKQSKRNKRRSLNKFNNQKGFTLVELVVVMAILSILGVAIYGFFHTSSNGYKRTEQEVDLLNEAQLTTNQFDNMIIDSTKGLDYAYDTATVKNVSITSDADIADPAAVVKKTFAVTNETEAYRIEWEKATKKVTVTKITPSGAGEPSLLAEYVSGFSVSLLRAKTQRVVEFHFDFLNGTQTYDINHNITMRNKVVVNGKSVSEYEDAPWWKITSVDIYYGGVRYTGKTIPVTVTGAQQTIDLTAQVNGINLPATKKVTWMIGGNTDTSTIVTSTGDLSCTVTLGAGEKSKRIAVTATADVKNEGDKTNAKASTYISMKSLDDTSDDGLLRGGQYILTADKLLKYEGTIQWGFKTIDGYPIGNEVQHLLSLLARRVEYDENGKQIILDSIWKEYGESWEVDNNNDHYIDCNNKWNTNDLDFFILDTSGLERGKCKISTGIGHYDRFWKDYRYQLQVEARIYDDEGNLVASQVIGADEKTPGDVLYMDKITLKLQEKDGSVLKESDYKDEDMMVGITPVPIILEAGETKEFYAKPSGYVGTPYINLVSGNADCFQTQSYNPTTGLAVFRVKENIEQQLYLEYNIGIADFDVYQLQITVLPKK